MKAPALSGFGGIEIVEYVEDTGHDSRDGGGRTASGTAGGEEPEQLPKQRSRNLIKTKGNGMTDVKNIDGDLSARGDALWHHGGAL